MKDYEKNYNEFWKEIVENPDGTLNKEAVKKELCDFSYILDQTRTIIYGVTGGRLSYPNYPAETVLSCHEDHLERCEEDRKEDDRECGECSLCGSSLPIENTAYPNSKERK